MADTRTPAASSTGASEPNQCDGCRRGMPLVDGIHRDSRGYDMIGCTANRYPSEPPPPSEKPDLDAIRARNEAIAILLGMLGGVGVSLLLAGWFA